MKLLTTAALLLFIVASPLSAQLTTDQRVFDFQSLAALFEKRYAPADWKLQALGVDAFNLGPWLARVQAAKDDLEFFEIEAEYVAQLQDTHTGFQMNSSFGAYLGATSLPGGVTLLGMTVDIYDGKVLIDSIGRAGLPSSTYPFQIGDELVSVDGVSAQDWIARLSKWRQYGNPTTTRRFAASQIINRSQSVFPRAVETPDRSTIEVRRASGAVETYTIPWTKTGFPITTVGPVPSPHSVVSHAESATSSPDYMQALEALNNYKLPGGDPLYSVYSLGARTPAFRAGLPSSFVQRLGINPLDFHFSGAYTSGGLKIGLLRIPNFAPSSRAAAVSELKTEIDYFQKNTDGLVIDVTRNPGGGCYMLDVAAALTPYPFYFFGQQIRATQTYINSFQSSLDAARSSGAPQSVIDTYQLYLDEATAAYAANRQLTVPIPACNQNNSPVAPVSENNLPAATVYTKPIIILIDELSISAADIFPAMMQDNHRALLVGVRSSGGGGSVSGWFTGQYSESYSTNTDTLVARRNRISTREYPSAPLVENIGSRPDVTLDFMTRANLISGGSGYVNQFSQILIQQINNPSMPFAIPNKGAVSLVTSGSSTTTTGGYARITSNDYINGFAIMGYRQKNVLLSEAAVPGGGLIQSGRIFAEINPAVDTGITIANPNDQPAEVAFYFTGPSGDFGTGSITVPSKGQTSGFLDQAPFSGGSTLSGTFTFNSTVPVAVAALRGFTNERQEFLMTALPVVDLSAPPTAASAPVSPQFMDGGPWTTQVELVNPTDSAIQGSIVFKDQTGATISTVAYSIPSRASQKVGSVSNSQTVQSGYVVVQPSDGSVPPVTLVIFCFRKDGITVSETGVRAVDSGSAYRVYAEASGSFDSAAVGSMQTGITVVNPSSVSAVVALELFRLDGTPTGLQGTLVVPAFAQSAKYLNQIPGLTPLSLPFQGFVRVSSPSAVAVLGIRNRYNERADLLMTPVPSSNEAIPGAFELFIPDFDDGGGFTTQFVVFNGSSTEQSAGVIRLFSQSGTTVNLLAH